MILDRDREDGDKMKVRVKAGFRPRKKVRTKVAKVTFVICSQVNDPIIEA